ncbi:MAG: serine/threonine-protein phosphatase, partial [Spirochaetes bacterium]|nr:serine/threonine-protein phosphatase [Spirochaetota bacterium]
ELINKQIRIIFAEEDYEEEEEEKKEALFEIKFKELIKKGSIRNCNLILQSKSGEKMLTSINGSIMRNTINKIVGILLIVRDMREILKYLGELERKNIELGTSNRFSKEYYLILEKDIDQAKEYQTKLNFVDLPKIHNMRFYSRYVPYEIIGGDILDIIKLNNKIIFYILDIAGHGVPASILSTYIKANLDHWIKQNEIISPQELIFLLKDSIKEHELFRENLLTIFIGCIDINTLKLTYLSAGHLSPIIYSTNNDKKIGTDKSIDFLELKDTHMVITDLIENNDYKNGTIQLNDNTKIFLYSDGIIEWKDRNKKFFGSKKLKDYVLENGLTEKSINNLINKKLNINQMDDISCILIDIKNSFEKTYYCNLDSVDEIVDDFKSEIKNRYSNEIFYGKSLQCFNELITNAIEHGNKNDKNKKISVRIIFDIDFVNFSVCDEGDGFDWKSCCKKNDLENSNSELRGRGLFLVNYFSNSLYFNQKGNEIGCVVSNG